MSAYGIPEQTIHESAWIGFLSVLFGVPAGHAAAASLREIVRSAPLATPGEAANASAGQLVQVLAPIPRGPQKATVVRTVAAWWLTEFGDQVSPEWNRGIEHYRESLRQIRGLGPATVDELLLFVVGLPLFPISRPALRVAVRHGWLDLSADDQEAQAFFVGGLNGEIADLRRLVVLVEKVSADYCGREPKCDGCPLQTTLPDGGPRDPQAC
jgi:endonuclease-3 related protein